MKHATIGTLIQTTLKAAVAAGLLAAPVSAQSAGALEQIHAMAASANSFSAHATVAKQYRLHAEALDTMAAEHEKNVRELTRVAGASLRKNPGSASRMLQNEKTKAMEARRWARETMVLADHHLRLAVESQAVAGN